MFDGKVLFQVTGNHAEKMGLPAQARPFGANNRTTSSPELRDLTRFLQRSSGVVRTLSGDQHHPPRVEQRQVVSVEAATQYQEEDFTGKEAEKETIALQKIHSKVEKAISELTLKVGKDIGVTYFKSFTEELSFVVTSRVKKNMTNRGMLLFGNPGDGKTFLMEAFATAMGRCVDCEIVHVKGVSFLGKNEEETTANFHKILTGIDPAHGSEETSTRTLRPLRVICIDEFDACVVETPGRLNDQVRVVNNLFKCCLSGSTDSGIDNVFIIATTNDEKNIPRPLLRSGRIGRSLFIPAPNLKETQIFIERFCKDNGISTESFNPVKVATLSHQKEQSVAQIKDMVLRAYQLAEVEEMKRMLNLEAENSGLSICEEGTVPMEPDNKKAMDDATIQQDAEQDCVVKVKYKHFYEVLYPNEKLANTFRNAMEGFSSEYSTKFYSDLDHSRHLPEALRIIRRVSNGKNKSGIIFVTGNPGSGRSAFATQLMKLASPEIFRATATPGELEEIDPSLLVPENEFCGRIDGFYPSQSNYREYSIDENVHVLRCIAGAQERFASIVLIENGDALMKPLEPCPIRGYRNKNMSFESANPALYLDTWHQFIDNPQNRNMVLIILTTKSAADIKEYSGIKGMVLGEFTMPSSISESDMEKLMVHYGLSEEERIYAGKLFSSKTMSIKNFVDYMNKTVTDGQFNKAELERLIKLNYSPKHNFMYL